jgi:hypothetical protein
MAFVWSDWGKPRKPQLRIYQKLNFRQNVHVYLCRIWGSHGGENEDGCLLAASIIRSIALIALMMEAARTSETLVNFYQTTRRYNPGDNHLHVYLLCAFSVIIILYLLSLYHVKQLKLMKGNLNIAVVWTKFFSCPFLVYMMGGRSATRWSWYQFHEEPFKLRPAPLRSCLPVQFLLYLSSS